MRFPIKFTHALLALSFAAQTAAFAAEPAADAASSKPLSYVQLRNALMDFADEYMQVVGQAADTIRKNNPASDLRAGIHSLKLFPCSSAFTIATESNSHMALLDMVVLVYLQGSVWKETLPKRFGDGAAGFLESQRQLETDIDAIAIRALGEEQLGKLKALVGEWRAAHPDQRYVSYIRFADFTETRGDGPRRQSSGNPLSIGGLLSAFQLVNMDETTRSVDQARMLGERALYLSERMPTMIRWQTEMLFYSLADTPETKGILGATQTLKDLPILLAAERKAAVEQLASETERRGRALIWEAAKALLVVALAVFLLALLYRFLSKKI